MARHRGVYRPRAYELTPYGARVLHIPRAGGSWRNSTVLISDGTCTLLPFLATMHRA